MWQHSHSHCLVDTGTIGGQNMQMYTRNLRAGGTVYADVSMDTPKGNISRVEGVSAHYTTFHGSLNGTRITICNG